MISSLQQINLLSFKHTKKNHPHPVNNFLNFAASVSRCRLLRLYKDGRSLRDSVHRNKMNEADAREARRRRILENSEKRLQRILGVASSNEGNTSGCKT